MAAESGTTVHYRIDRGTGLMLIGFAVFADIVDWVALVIDFLLSLPIVSTLWGFITNTLIFGIIFPSLGVNPISPRTPKARSEKKKKPEGKISPKKRLRRAKAALRRAQRKLRGLFSRRGLRLILVYLLEMLPIPYVGPLLGAFFWRTLNTHYLIKESRKEDEDEAEEDRDEKEEKEDREEDGFPAPYGGLDTDGEELAEAEALEEAEQLNEFNEAEEQKQRAGRGEQAIYTPQYASGINTLATAGLREPRSPHLTGAGGNTLRNTPKVADSKTNLVAPKQTANVTAGKSAGERKIAAQQKPVSTLPERNPPDHLARAKKNLKQNMLSRGDYARLIENSSRLPPQAKEAFLNDLKGKDWSEGKSLGEYQALINQNPVASQNEKSALYQDMTASLDAARLANSYRPDRGDELKAHVASAVQQIIERRERSGGPKVPMSPNTAAKLIFEKISTRPEKWKGGEDALVDELLNETVALMKARGQGGEVRVSYRKAA